ncbi:hypothetical protein NP493_1052g00023 [Ridgeia piscesae]|uniref:Uncharacterized protein n=1 Tax=Ridgeia piscesae TaxID=27915 RepID=A0AAD9NK72_RIDPI|nr:hypothetical protein NP493_1052g00023 [Ridgeia piscesae]
MPNFTTLEPLSKLRPYFEIELLHAGNDETLTEVCVSIGVRCHPYFPKPVITNRYVQVKKMMKVGDRLGIGVENINMLADTYLAEGSTVQLYGRLGRETVSYG